MLILDHVTKKQPANLYDDLTVTFHQSEGTYLIKGEVGSGKTTLLYLLFGLDSDYQGRYTLFNRDAKELTDAEWQNLRAKNIQLVFQEGHLISFLTVEETLLFVQPRPEIFEVNKLLRVLNLEQQAKKKVKDLSGGQKQRLSVARALIHHPNVLLMDEPSGNLDDKHLEEMMSCLEKYKKQGMMLLIVSHDSRMIQYADCVYTLANRRLTTEPIIEKKHQTTAIKSRDTQSHFQWLRYALIDLKRQMVSSIKYCFPTIVLLSIFITVFLIMSNSAPFLTSLTKIIFGCITAVLGCSLIVLSYAPIRLRYKEFSILLTQGCKRTQIIKIICIELLVQLSFSFVVAVFLCWIFSSKVRLIYFTIENFLYLICSVLLIFFILIAWSSCKLSFKSLVK